MVPLRESSNRRISDRRLKVRRRSDRGPTAVERRSSNPDRRREDRRVVEKYPVATELRVRYGEPMDLTALQQRIDVRDPYFAIEELILDTDHALHAVVPVQQVLGSEMPPITAGEAARHMAILGACGAAIFNPNPGKHYFLAYAAQMWRSPGTWPRNTELLAKRLKSETRSRLLNKRVAFSKTRLSTMDGEGVYNLTTYYHVLSEKIFLRLYEHMKRDMRSVARSANTTKKGSCYLRRNPYTKPYPIHDVHISNGAASASLGEIQAEFCKGHFPMIPALPKAFLMYSMSHLAGLVLQHFYDDAPITYFVKEGTVTSDNLGFAGSVINISASFVKNRGTDFLFFCEALTSMGVKIGDMWITLTAPSLPEAGRSLLHGI